MPARACGVWRHPEILITFVYIYLPQRGHLDNITAICLVHSLNAQRISEQQPTSEGREYHQYGGIDSIIIVLHCSNA